MTIKMPISVEKDFVFFPYETARIEKVVFSIEEDIEFSDTLSEKLIRQTKRIYRNGDFIPVTSENAPHMDNKVVFYQEETGISIAFWDNRVCIGHGVKLR